MKRYLLSACTAALIASPAYGQTHYSCDGADDCPDGPIIITDRHIQDYQDYQDYHLVVVGARIDHAERGVLTSPVTIIASDDIRARGNATIAELLRSVPGAAINRSGSAGSLTQLRLRGSEGNHVLVLIDGIEVSNPNTGEFDFASLRAEDVLRVEVLRGEQSALWGSDAIGGVVNIITRAGDTNEGYKVSLEAGSFNSLEGQLSAVVPLGIAALSINGNVFSTDGYDVSGLGGEADGAKSRSLNVGLNNVELGGLTLSGKYTGSYALSQFDSDTDFNGRLDNTNAALETNTKAGRVSARFDLGGFDNLINLSVTDTNQFTTGTSFRNDTTGKRTQANWAAERSWDAHSLTALVETEKEEFSNFGGAGGFQNQEQSTQNHAIAADYRYSQNAITITASARQDFNDRFDNSLTWRAGAGYAFENIGGRVRASVGAGVKNPTMTELFGFFPGSFVPNADLIPEKSLGYNIGYDQTLGDFKLSLDYFRSDLEDEIFTVFNPDFTSTVRNRDTDSTREGIELEGRGKIGDRLRLRASATFLDAKENDLREVRRPEFLASSSVTWHIMDSVNLTVMADHTGSQFDTDFATFSRVELPAFTLVGANVRWDLNETITLSLRGENLLDEEYQEVVGYKSQGRGIYAGFTAGF